MSIPPNLTNLGDQFNVIQKQLPLVDGAVFLVFPKDAGVDWNKDNLIYRSSVWNSDGQLISAGFPKFFNWGEKPHLSPTPKLTRINTFVEKLDGSLLIVSKYKGHYILRTRGTIDATVLNNGYELNSFKESILPKLNSYNCCQDTWDSSFLFEWLSGNNQIVIYYGSEPKFKLIGEIYHDDCILTRQTVLDCLANKLNLDRPQTYNFTDIDGMLKEVNGWKGLEGLVVYSNNDQTLHKVKSDWYLLRHRLASNLSSASKVLDVWCDQGMPNYQTTYDYVVKTFDYERAEKVKVHIRRITDLKDAYDSAVRDAKEFISKFDSNTPKKDKAIAIIGEYKPRGLESVAFNVLNDKLNVQNCKKFINDRL